jgi:flagellar biosynthesis chaperone FliJ
MNKLAIEEIDLLADQIRSAEEILVHAQQELNAARKVVEQRSREWNQAKEALRKRVEDHTGVRIWP